MQTEIAVSKKLQNKFLSFRKKVYGEKKLYVDNSYFMLKEIFSDKLHFTKSLSITPLMVEDDGANVLCEGIIAVANDLPEYVQLCFFEALEGVSEAVNKLVDEAVKIGKSKGCKRLCSSCAGDDRKHVMCSKTCYNWGQKIRFQIIKEIWIWI